MQTVHRSGDVFVAKFTSEELLCLSNILNEVLRGFRVDDFEHRLKASKESTEELWGKFTPGAPQAGKVTLSASEIESLGSATRLCHEEFGDEEFSTRLGVSAAKALKLVDALEKLLR